MTNKKIQLTTNVDGQSVNVYPVTKSEFVEFSDGKTLDERIDSASTEHKHDLATPAKDGFMSKEDKAKLDGVTNYTHPNTHAATMITEDNDHRFVTDTEKNKWNNKADTSLATNASNGLMSASDKQKIDDLNNQFKNRDDKIEKNKEDIKSWNDEMIDKKYQYFNKENNTINDSIVSKTFDMVIQGKTLHNLMPLSGHYNTMGSVVSGSVKIFKINTEYTMIVRIKNANNPKKMTGLMGRFYKVSNNTAITVLDNLEIKNGEYKRKFILDEEVKSFEGLWGRTQQQTGDIICDYEYIFLEGDWVDKEVPEYFEGIKSFGEEGNKINVLSKNINLLPPFEEWQKLNYDQIDVKNGYEYSIKLTGGWNKGLKTYVDLEIGKKYCMSAVQNGIGLVIYTDDGDIGTNVVFTAKKKRHIVVVKNGIEVKDNASIKNVFLYEGDKVKNYFMPQEKDEKNISLNKYGLNDGLKSLSSELYDEINYTNQNIVKRIGKHSITSNEDIIFYDSHENTIAFLCRNKTHESSWTNSKKLMCNILPSIGDRIYQSNNEGVSSDDDGFIFRINKSKLNTLDIKGFKQWIDSNKPIVYFKLKEETRIPFIEEINLNTFSNKTYITSNNNIKGKLSFSVPINTAANLENGSKRLNNIEDFIDTNKNNIDKISKLEEGAITSSLNIIDLQKDIKNNNDYTHYSGNNISIVNSKESRTSNMIIKGETLQNIANYEKQVFRNSEKLEDNVFKLYYGGDENASNVEILENYFYKPNTTYTIVVNILENTTDKRLGISNIRSNIIDYSSLSFNGYTGTNMLTIRTANEIATSSDKNQIYFCSWDRGQKDLTKYIKFKFMILEGDWTNKIPPKYFEGIKSLGEINGKNEYKINLLSTGKNLANIDKILQDSKKCTFEDGYLKYYQGNERLLIKDIFKPNTQYIISGIYRCYRDNPVALKIYYTDGSNKSIDIKSYKKDTFNYTLSDSGKTIKEIQSLWTYADLQVGIKNLQIEEKINSDTNSEYELYKESINNILLKDSLHKSNYLYEKAGKINIYKKFITYKFTGEEPFEKYVSQSDGYLCLTLKQNDIKVNGDIYCNNFINQSIWNPGTLKEGIELNTTSGNKVIYIKIKSSKLISNDTDGFKLWLKENPTTIVYELENPIIETLEDIVDLNIATFDKYTNVSFLNGIPGNLEFDTANNLSTQNLNNSKNINTTIKEIKEVKEKLSKNRLNHYEGESVICKNTLNSRTSNMIIKGETLQNIFKTKGDYTGTVIEIDMSLFKPNTQYTIFHNTKHLGLLDYVIFASDVFTDVYHLKDKTVFKTTATLPSRSYFHCYFKDETLGVPVSTFNKIKILILEGDWSNKNTPNYFYGVKSTGEEEENKIKILSNGQNLFNINGNVNECFDGMINNEDNIVQNNKLIIGNWSSSHHGKGQILRLKPNTTYRLKATRHNNIDISIGIAKKKDFNFKDYRNTDYNPIDFNFKTDNETEYCISFSRSGTKPTIKPIISDIVVCENESIKYADFKEDLKEIQLSSPLSKGNYLYEDNNKIKIYKTSKEYNITEKDKLLLSSIQSEGFLTIKIKKEDLKDEGRIICDSFLNDNTIWKQDVLKEGIQSVYYENEGSWVFIKIKKNRLSTPDLNGFREWLKSNTIFMVCELKDPITEVIDGYIDINVETYEYISSIRSNNNINGYLSFDIPVNLSSQSEKNTKDINKIISVNNDVGVKCSKLEDAQMTTALNVLELQKHTAMLNNGEINEYSNHSGILTQCNNTLDSRTENMIIKGKTLVNLFNGKKVNIGSYSSFTCTYKDGVFDLNAKTVNVIISYPKMELEDNKKYTLICHVMENTLTPMTGTAFRLIRPESYGAEVFLPANFTRGVFKTTFTTNKNNASGWNDTHANLFVISATGRIKFSIMVFEGDINYIPYHFEGIKSLGEQENNNINLVSYTDNLLYNIKKVFLSVENGKESISDIYFTSDFVYAPLSTYYKSLLDNEYVLTNVFYYGKDKEYLYQINIVEKDSFDNYPNAKYIRLVGRRADKGTNVNLDNVKIIVGSKKYTEYFESNINEKPIQLIEPLRSVNNIKDILYQNTNNISLIKTLDQYIFTGEENWVQSGQTGNGTMLFYLKRVGIKPATKNIICDNFVRRDYIWNDSSKEGINMDGEINIMIRISISKLSSPNLIGFKSWLKANKTTIIYELNEPVTKILPDIIDTNIDTYKNTTYVTTDNSIKGELEFKTQNNFGVIMKNVNRCISKIFNSLNNILNIKGE